MEETKAFLINEITDGMIPIKAKLTKKNGYVRITLQDQRLTICVSLKEIERLKDDC